MDRGLIRIIGDERIVRGATVSHYLDAFSRHSQQMLEVDLGGYHAHHFLSKYLREIIDSLLSHSLDHVDVI